MPHSYHPHDRPASDMGLKTLLARQFGTISALIVLGLVVLAAMALASWNVADPSLNTANDHPIGNWLGFWGAAYADLSMQFLGLGAVALLLAPFFWAVRLLGQRHFSFSPWQQLGRFFFWPVSTLFFSGALATLPIPALWPLPSGLGGMFGDKVLGLCQFLLAMIPLPQTIAVQTAISFISPIMVLGIMAPLGLWSALYAGGVVATSPIPDRNRGKKTAQRGKKQANHESAIQESAQAHGWAHGWGVVLGWILHLFIWLIAIGRRLISPSQSPSARPSSARHEPNFATHSSRAHSSRALAKTQKGEERRQIPSPAGEMEAKNFSFELPYLDYLSGHRAQARDESLGAEILSANAHRLAHILEDFGVKGEIIAVRPGPVVTLYEFEPAPGIKSSRIISLADDIARSMSAISARIAVISGRNAIGIELPNQKRETVYLREIFESDAFAASKARLALALGKTIGGEAVIADIAKMPHLLVAGTTGSGKSVAINTMIMSLVYRMTPSQCRLIMVDPKMLELSVYDGIPHLLTPVVTDPKKAIIALKWAVREMETRYRKMAKIGVRNIDGFNDRLRQAMEKQETLSRTVQTGFDKHSGEPVFETEIFDYVPMPYIVVIIDEMADLMLVAGKEIEAAVQRLAQMARAAGIHVIMATQRPSVDVITGTIKANFPTRISFAVTSKIDSRTILGEQGAEQLLGQGDMLFMMGGGRMSRVHGPFISDEEVEQVVAHLKLQAAPDYLDSVMEEEDVTDEGGSSDPISSGLNDDPYDQAVAVVLRDRKASTSYIQRRLGIGYNRAASLIERMEQEGVVSPPGPAGKREILVETADEEEPWS